MDVRKASLEALIKVLEKNKPADDVIKVYSQKVLISTELIALVNGVIKQKLTLDYFIESLSNRPLKKLSYPVLNALRLAIYELEYLKTPDYAVLNSYVELLKQYEKNSSAFLNGVLRNFLRQKKDLNFSEYKNNPAKLISIKHSHPLWLVESWIKQYGEENTEKICIYNNQPPKLTIRINTLKTTKEDLVKLFKDNNINYYQEKYYDDCLIITHKGKIEDIPGFNRGYWLVQSESSSLVAKVLAPQEGENILDLCAAPGGKTAHIAALTNNKSKITAIDVNPKRLKKIEENCQRLGITSVKTVKADAVDYSCDELFDRILIDAPCSNTGVLGKRVDARWNKTPDDIKNLSELQFKILNNAKKLLKKGGVIVYSTCSIEQEENQQIIDKFLEQNKDFKADSIKEFLPWEISQDIGSYQILQSMHNIDGFFIAKIKKL